jgi:tetratricopeptide (TPR) repeat protein
VIVQGQGGRTPEVALVEPEVVRLLFRVQPLIYSQRYAEALALIDRADSLQRDPNAIKYHVLSGAWRAYAWVETGRDAEAVALARRMMALDPSHLLARQVVALGLSHQGRLDEALREIERIEAMAPGDRLAAALRAGIDERLRAVAQRRGMEK